MNNSSSSSNNQSTRSDSATSNSTVSSSTVAVGKLYIVATPIGHLSDLSKRAEDTLKSVEIIAAEDTRRSRILLDHIGAQDKKLRSLHSHNESHMSTSLLHLLQQGSDIAVISDAGTPMINDPGFELVRLAHAHQVDVIPIPGCSAPIAALSVCPLPCHPFRFVGFAPSKSSIRKQFLQQHLQHSDGLIFFETPHRIKRCLADLGELTQRRIMLARELTKQYETLYVGHAHEVSEALGEHPKGELVVIVESVDEVKQDINAQQLLSELLQELPPAAAARLAANILGAKRKDMYNLVQQIKQN